MLAMLALLCIIIWGIYTEHEETVHLTDLESVIKKGSTMHNSIIELDPCSRQKYMKMLKHLFDDEHETLFSKYYKSVTTALCVAICSEYIISGNLTKPLGGVAKTIVSTAWMTSLAS